MGDPYASCPVDRKSREIRLLKLRPGNDEGVIRCDMQTYRPHSCPPYTALSYTWGADIIHTNIEINGVEFPVRENLWDFLHQQLLQSNHGPFWMDALCIQQSEVDERNHQVRLMSSIYSEASKVLIWLGKEGDDSDIAMDVLEIQDSVKWVNSTFSPYFSYMAEDESDDIDYDAIDTRGIMNKRRQRLSSTEELSVLSLCKRKYWSRMWIIQEIMLAKYLEIRCGSKIAPLSNLVLALEDIASALKEHPTCGTAFLLGILTTPAMALASIRGQSRPRVSYGLQDLLETYGDHECGDIRDKVYALLGVARYGWTIKIDYRKSARNVFIDLLYHESDRMRWDESWDADSLAKFAQLLKRILGLSLSEPEIGCYIIQSRGHVSKKPPPRWENDQGDHPMF